MFTDYAKKIHRFTNLNSLDKLRKKNAIITLPSHLSNEHIDNEPKRQELIDELVLLTIDFDPEKPILFSLQKQSIQLSDTAYFVYEVAKNNVEKAVEAFLNEKIQGIKEHDLMVRDKMAVQVASIFDTVIADSDCSKIVLDNLKTCNVHKDFRINHSFKTHQYIKLSGSYSLEVNIHLTAEHKTFLKKVLDLTDDKDVFYRGYFMFSNTLELREINLKVYSDGNLNQHHFELISRCGQLCIVSKEKTPKYIYKERLDTFYQLFDPADYKFTLYQLLRFHHDWEFRGSTRNKYIDMFPELYIPSAYDFANMSTYEWDTRFLLRDMIEI